MTRAELVAEVVRKVQDSTYTPAMITGLFNACRQQIAGAYRLPALRAMANLATVPNCSAVPLPDTYHTGLFACYNASVKRELTVYDSTEQLLDDYAFDLDQAGAVWAVAAEPTLPQAAQGTITVTALPTLGDTVTVATQLFTFVATRGAAGEITLGSTEAECAGHIATAMTADLTTATATASGTSVVLTAVATGTAGNVLVLTTTSASLTLDGSGTLGGTQQGVQTAWLRYVRSPSDGQTLRVHYYRQPIDLTKDSDVPYELPPQLQRPLLVGFACREIFAEIYEDDPNGAAVAAANSLFQDGLTQLARYLGPYAQAPQRIKQTAPWGALT